MSIKTGKYFNEEKNTFNTEFFDIVSDFDKRLLDAYNNTKLPEYPNSIKINKLIMEMNYNYLDDNKDILSPNLSDHIFSALYDTALGETEDYYE